MADDDLEAHGVYTQDVSALITAQERVAEELGRFVPELEALGFTPLGITRSHMQRDEAFEAQLEDDDDDPAELQARADGGDEGAALKLEGQRTRHAVRDMMAHGTFAWIWVSPDGLDLVTLEHAEDRDWCA
ncbi:MAG: hypothetical protein KC656_28625, partial [Myxococcales bacterium]|nr:hypothetical protein [Myxococcales bacterium]